jgi:ubiquinol-cytochrome c reductase subunit 6
MGWYDYLTDLTTSFTSSTPYYAEAPSKDEDVAGQMNEGKDASSGGKGTAQQDRDATTRGGASDSTPAGAGRYGESGEEEQANKADAEKAQARTSSGGEDGGDDGGEDEAEEGGDEEEEEEAEEEEEEEEPEDPKPKIEEGKLGSMIAFDAIGSFTQYWCSIGRHVYLPTAGHG